MFQSSSQTVPVGFGALPAKVSFDALVFPDIAFPPQILVRWLSGRKRRFAKALYLLSGTEGSNPSLTVVLSAFPLQWLIYSLSPPRRNEAQRNARKCQKSFKFFSSAKT
jgi:hypothetical protein